MARWLLAALLLAGCAHPAPIDGADNDVQAAPPSVDGLSQPGNGTWMKQALRGNFTTVQYFNAEYILLGKPLMRLPPGDFVFLNGTLEHVASTQPVTVRFRALQCLAGATCEAEATTSRDVSVAIARPAEGDWEAIFFPAVGADAGTYDLVADLHQPLAAASQTG